MKVLLLKFKSRFYNITILLFVCLSNNSYCQKFQPRLDGIYVYKNDVKGHTYIGDSAYFEQFKFPYSELANHWQSCINIPKCSKENRIVKADLDSSEKLSVIHFLNDTALLEAEWSCNGEEFVQYVTLLILIHKYGLMNLNIEPFPFQIANNSITFNKEIINYKLIIIDQNNLIGSFRIEDPILPPISEDNLDYHFIEFNK